MPTVEDTFRIMHRRPWLVTPTLLIAASCSPTLGDPPAAPSIDRYRTAFRDAAGTQLVAECDRDQLAAQLGSVRVLWLGDNHANSQVHALQSELLTDLQKRGCRMAFVLEAIGSQDEPAVKRFLSSEITLVELRKEVRQRWPASWLDDPELDPWFYRSMLAIARTRQWPVLALEPTPRAPLAERDELMAAAVRDAAAAHSDRLVVVIVGQAHLLGEGDLIQRTGLPSLAIGGEPTAMLRGLAKPASPRGTLLQSDAGIWWFGELLRAVE